MFNEPCVHNSLYSDALAVVLAESPEQALTLLEASKKGWLVDELRRLTPAEYDLNTPTLLYSDVRGD